MSGAGGVGGADRAGSNEGVGGAGSVGGADDRSDVSEAEASSIADEAVGEPDEAAAAEAESLADGVDTIETEDRGDTVEAEATRAEVEAELDARLDAEAGLDDRESAADDVPADVVADAAALDVESAPQTPPPAEEPGMLESVATWAGQTAKGYATGAVNGVLDAANLVNAGVNAGLDAVGIDYEFKTDMGIAPTSEAERHAQNAVTVASAAAGVAGLAKSAPAIARGIDEVASMVTKGRAPGPSPAGVTPAAAAAAAAQPLGDLRPSEIARIQAAADELGESIYVVGSAAKGARRNVDTDLPLAGFGGSKAGTRSDIDYAVRNGIDDVANELDLPDVDPSFGVRGIDYLNLDNSPAIRFSPGRAPELLGQGGGRIDLD